jgi:hypothetical protein
VRACLAQPMTEKDSLKRGVQGWWDGAKLGVHELACSPIHLCTPIELARFLSSFCYVLWVFCSSLVIVNAAFEGTDRLIVTFGVISEWSRGCTVEPGAMDHSSSTRWRATGKGTTQRWLLCPPTPRPERWQFRGILGRCRHVFGPSFIKREKTLITGELHCQCDDKMIYSPNHWSL